MATNKDSSSFTEHPSNPSTPSDGNPTSPSTLPSNVVQYGPIQVRHCRKQAPTIATGRRPKNLVLFGDEAMKREKRREKNRDAARKLKEKRESIESELNQKLTQLQHEHVSLQSYLKELEQRRAYLLQRASSGLVASVDSLLTNEEEDITLFFEQYLGENPNNLDESSEDVPISDTDIDFDSTIGN